MYNANNFGDNGGNIFYKNLVYKEHIKTYFKDLNLDDIKQIDQNRALELKDIAKDVKFTKLNPVPSDFVGIGKFSNMLKHIRTANPKLYKLNSIAEQYLLFMFCIDPELEAIKIFNENKSLDAIKKKCEEKFGVYSFSLIAIEGTFIKTFMLEKEDEAKKAKR